MTASSEAPFAADLFDKPSYSSTPISPQPRSVFLKALLIGGILGAGIVLALKHFGAILRKQIRLRLPVQKLPHFLRRQLQF